MTSPTAQVIEYDITIIGGGLAGLTASICLAKEGLKVLVIEKNQYPHHKVCGEYVSNEVRPFLEHLGLNLNRIGVIAIDEFSISTPNKKQIHAKLPLGGFGVSRYALDKALYDLALLNQVDFRFETVLGVRFKDDFFETYSKNAVVKSEFVIGAQGKRSIIDKALKRSFIDQKSPWIGVKMHYHNNDFPKNKVELHCFDGGYGGLSKTEKGTINFCYLVKETKFKSYRNINRFNAEVITESPYLKKFIENSTPVFEKPLTIAQISFSKKAPIENHIIMCGDSAGLIHPLCGNGMAMAIHSAKLASECILSYFNNTGYVRLNLEKDYTKKWDTHFKKRLLYGRAIQNVLLNQKLTNTFFSILPKSERIVTSLIKRTHGKPILV